MRRIEWLAKHLKTERGLQLIAYVILAVTVGIMISVVRPTLNASGYLSAWDAGGHLLKAQYFAHHLLNHGHLSGWFPLWHGGFEIFQFYPPLLYYLLGPLTYLFKPELALRLVMAALWIGLVPATYYFLRSFSLNRVIAALGTSFLLALNASFGIGLGALYGVGLLPNGLGFILAIWALGRLKRDLSQPDRSPRQLIKTGLAFGLLLLAHTFSAYWFVAVSLILLLTEIVGRKGDIGWQLKRYGLMFGIGLLVSAYWWVPLFLGIAQMGPTGAIQQTPTADILKNLLLSTDSGGITMSLLALTGAVYLAVTERWRTLWFFGVSLVFSLLLSIDAINNLLPFSGVVASSQFIRFQAFVTWLLLALAAIGLAGIWAVFKRTRLPYVPEAALLAIVIILFTQVVWPTLTVKRGFINVLDNSATDDLGKVAEFLNVHRVPGEFVLTEFNWQSRFYYGSPHFLNQRLPVAAPDTLDLDGNFPEGTIGASKPVLIASTLEQTRYLNAQEQYLRDRGVRYVITTFPGTRTKLATVSWLRQVWSGRSMAIFEVMPFDTPFGLPAGAAPALESVRYDDPGRYTLRFREPVSLPAGTALALSYHPWLHVSADGRRVASRDNINHQLTLAGPANEIWVLTVTYRPPAAAKIPGAVSALALIGVLAGLLRPDLLGFLNPRRVVRRVRRRARTVRANGRPRRAASRPRSRS